MAHASVAQEERESSFGFLIQTLGRRIDLTMRERLKEVDIDSKILANLMLLSKQDGVNQRHIGEQLDFPEYYTSRNIDALVEAGYAERRPDPNSRRSFLIYLTEVGQKKAKLLPSIIDEINELYLGKLTKQEQETAIALLQKAAGLNNAQ